MGFSVHDARFDVVVVAGPRVDPFPSAGVRALSTLCAESGLTLALIGGETLRARGVLPLPGTGGIVLAEDLQKRVHRIHARALVRVTSPSFLPDPFPGWRSQGLIPLTTAIRLLKESKLQWSPSPVILGTGNRALRLGSSLLDRGFPGVICVESFGEWGAKRFAGWEVEKRRFEIAGGKIIEAKPVSLSAKAPLLWDFRMVDDHGVRIVETSRVISAGPFKPRQDLREYPPGSLMFEMQQTASSAREEDFEGWVLEEERGRWLAGKIIKSLTTDPGPQREEIEATYRRARSRLKRYNRHREEPFVPSWQGKWLSAPDSRQIRAFSGTPVKVHHTREIASIECIENIPCNLCEKACPESAITFSRVKGDKAPQLPVLSEADCTACGICLDVCPSATPVLIHEMENLSVARLTISSRIPSSGSEKYKAGELATLLNRRGDTLGSARVVEVTESNLSQRVQLEVPTHLAWEARGLRRPRVNAAVDKNFIHAQKSGNSDDLQVEVMLNGEKRLVRDKIPVSLALFETGQSRPQDNLYCRDGSCGLCQVVVDGVGKPGCQTPIHRGMSIRLDWENSKGADSALCPCMNISRDEIVDRVRQGNLNSPEAVLAATHVGEGKCHGQVCCESLERFLSEEGLDMDQWIDWRFPWSDWAITPGANE